MPGLRRNYRSIEEFEREELRPSFRIGFSIDDLEESAFEGELSFEMEAADAAFEAADDDLDDDDDDGDAAGDRDDVDVEDDEPAPRALVAASSQRSSPKRT